MTRLPGPDVVFHPQLDMYKEKWSWEREEPMR